MRNHHTGRAATAVLPFVFLLLLLSSCSIHTDDTATIALGDSLIYRGQLKDGKPEGLGVLMHGDSVIYSGNWHLGKRQGTGTVTDSHGRSAANGMPTPSSAVFSATPRASTPESSTTHCDPTATDTTATPSAPITKVSGTTASARGSGSPHSTDIFAWENGSTISIKESV